MCVDSLWHVFENTIKTRANSKKSPRGPTERTPKPEYLIALAIYLGVRWKGPIQFLMDQWLYPKLVIFS